MTVAPLALAGARLAAQASLAGRAAPSSYDGLTIGAPPGPVLALALASLLVSCIVLGLVDARTRRLPNALVGVVALCGVALLGSDLLCREPPALRVCWCAGTLAALGTCETLRRRLRGGRGIGFGDVKLIAAFALVLGSSVIVAVLLSCLLALAVEVPRRRRTFAFGPYLCLAMVVTCVGSALAALA